MRFFPPEAAAGELLPDGYWELTNQNLAVLAGLGVTVLVSSGDDGAPGFSATCPNDPHGPVANDRTCVSAGAPAGEAGAACRCGGVLVTLTTMARPPTATAADATTTAAARDAAADDDGAPTDDDDAPTKSTTMRCVLPNGIVGLAGEAGLAGSECVEIFESPACISVFMDTFPTKGASPAAADGATSTTTRATDAADDDDDARVLDAAWSATTATTRAASADSGDDDAASCEWFWEGHDWSGVLEVVREMAWPVRIVSAKH